VPLSLYVREDYDRALTSWPGVTVEDLWEARIAKVGGKVFCLLSDNVPLRVVYKCGETSFDLLTELDGISQAPYFAKRHWVLVFENSPLSEDELRAYVQRSYALVAKGLTRKLRSELGIADDLGI
jgi:predicted DNA-binding protein (MmcQ/YjbR family)